MRRALLALLLSLPFALASRPAFAGLDGAGASGVDAKSLSANPAAALGSGGDDAYFSDTPTVATVHYTRAEDATGPYRTTSANTLGQVPYFAWRHDLRASGEKHARWALGFSLATPTGSSLALPAEGPGRYHLIAGSYFAAYLTPVAAWEVSPSFRIGFGPSLVLGNLSVEKRIDLAPAIGALTPGQPPPPPETPALEGDFRITDAWGLAPSATLGFLWEPADDLRIGAGYVFATDITMRGRSHLTPSRDFAVSADGDFAYTKHLPPFLNGGVRWHAKPALVLWLEAQWIGWSRNRTSHLRISNSQIHGTNQDLQFLLDSLQINENQLVTGILDRNEESLNGDRDAGNAIAGGEWRFPRRWRARAELGWFRSSVPTKYMTPADLDFDTLLVGAGGTWSPDSHRLELGLALHRYIARPLNVRNSAFRSDSPDPHLQYPTGNGRYEAALTKLELSALVRF